MPQKILLVDDDLDDQFLFGEALRDIKADVELQTAGDGIDALEKLKQLPNLPDVIFLDLNMPRMNGKKLLEELKASKEFSGIPVIIYSTSSTPDDIRETKAAGAAAFITKPTNFDALCALLAETLQKTW